MDERASRRYILPVMNEEEAMHNTILLLAALACFSFAAYLWGTVMFPKNRSGKGGPVNIKDYIKNNNGNSTEGR